MRRLSNILLYSGAAACAVGALGLAVGFWVNLSAHAVMLIAKSLPFIVGGALLATGAAVGRIARRDRGMDRTEVRRTVELDPSEHTAEFPPPAMRATRPREKRSR
jgi:hypothetical protein